MLQQLLGITPGPGSQRRSSSRFDLLACSCASRTMSADPLVIDGMRAVELARLTQGLPGWPGLHRQSARRDRDELRAN